jgi:hypothetical protein
MLMMRDNLGRDLRRGKGTRGFGRAGNQRRDERGRRGWPSEGSCHCLVPRSNPSKNAPAGFSESAGGRLLATCSQAVRVQHHRGCLPKEKAPPGKGWYQRNYIRFLEEPLVPRGNTPKKAPPKTGLTFDRG